MISTSRTCLVGLLALFALSACSQPPVEAEAGNAVVVKTAAKAQEPGDVVNGFTIIAWEELMPEGEEERLAAMMRDQQAMLYGPNAVAEGSAADKAFQIGTFNTVKSLDGMKIRLPGFTVPFEYGVDAKITEFLLVPYFGACLHAPPPPPNQTVYITSEKPIRLGDLAQAVWVNGTLKTSTEETELADAAYTLVLDDLEEYTY